MYFMVIYSTCNILTGNRINQLNSEYLQGAKVLKTLNIKQNLLTVFPDLGDAKLTLRTLRLSQNHIVSIPSENLLGYKWLSNFDISNNRIVEFPNTCNENMWRDIPKMHVHTQNLRCDCKARHLLVNIGTSFDLLDCSLPARLSGKKVTSLNASELTCSGKFLL